MPGASEEGRGGGVLGQGGRRGQGVCISCRELGGQRRESLQGALGETPQFVTGALDRASVWPGKSSDLSTGVGF